MEVVIFLMLGLMTTVCVLAPVSFFVLLIFGLWASPGPSRQREREARRARVARLDRQMSLKVEPTPLPESAGNPPEKAE